MTSENLSDFFERTIVDAFIKYINDRDRLGYTFDSRPDLSERGMKAPDFKYIDKTKDKIMLLELSRLTVIDLGKYQKIKGIYESVKEELEGKVQGSFLLVIDSEQDCMSKMARGKDRERKKQDILDNVLKENNKMKIGDRREVSDGILLSKYSEDNSVISIEPLIMFDNPTEEQKNLIEILEEANDKFSGFITANSTTVLVILGTSSIFDEMTDLIEFSDLVIGRDLNLTNVDAIYEIELNTDWNINPIGLSQCYPAKRSENWCLHPELFEDQTKYRKAYFKYFHGSII